MENNSNSGAVGNYTNRLIHEKSPYLLQHASNPVDWFPWGDDAFEKARNEDKPVFLSIGYSTCHWCHVMAHESFEDPEVAHLMNTAFVNIKVDREERPDLDHIYMTACQMMTGRGGWPLTVIMTPDKIPFYAATYLPKNARWGNPGMMDMIPHIQSAWHTRRQDVLDASKKMLDALRRTEESRSGKDLDRGVLDKAYRELSDRFDAAQGGFSQAPKFPTPHNLLFLLRYWYRTKESRALDMVEKTLTEMRLGGIYDHVGFGIHRYATDHRWLVPHFEKMLYDQAMVSLAYLEAFQATEKPLYAETAQEIFRYVLRDMTSPEGGFYSAEDADSEGVEGKFYVWTEEDIRAVLDGESADLVIRAFNVTPNGNFTEEATGEQTGANILHLQKPLEALASDMQMPAAELKKRLASAGRQLFEARAARSHPHRDDKILTDWNGLMIAALARGSQVFNEPAYAGAAENAARCILKHLRHSDGRLLHRFRDGEAKFTAHLDDYAFFVWGLIELYEATFDPRYLETALALNEDMVTHFLDEQNGGFYFTPDDGENLILRKKEIYDGALPSGNAVAMHNLLRLARFTGRADLDEKAAGVGRAFSEQIRQFPSGYTQFLASTDLGIGPSFEVVITGAAAGRDTHDMISALRKIYMPRRVVIFRPSDGTASDIDRIAGFIRKHDMLDGIATAYVCVAHFCRLPTTNIDDMLTMLRSDPSSGEN